MNTINTSIHSDYMCIGATGLLEKIVDVYRLLQNADKY